METLRIARPGRWNGSKPGLKEGSADVTSVSLGIDPWFLVT
jgi:hypothetical protein